MRDEFAKLDTDKSGYITKDEMVTVISSEFQGDKVSVLNKLNMSGLESGLRQFLCILDGGGQESY